MFGWKKLDSDETNPLRQSVAEDLAWLVERYRRNKNHNSRSTYLILVKVFEQQCEVVDEKVTVKKKTGGSIVCNPSDRDATFDGYKGSGYQVQLCETYGDINNVQLMTAAIPETACESDSHAIGKIIERFDEHEMRPVTLLAATTNSRNRSRKKMMSGCGQFWIFNTTKHRIASRAARRRMSFIELTIANTKTNTCC